METEPCAHRIPFVVPLAEIEGGDPGKPKICALCEVGDVEIKPLPPALKEKALMRSLVPAQYRLPFQ